MKTIFQYTGSLNTMNYTKEEVLDIIKKLIIGLPSDKIISVEIKIEEWYK